jgi:hypothetical protein
MYRHMSTDNKDKKREIAPSQVDTSPIEESDTGGTFVSCNKSQHNIEYCNGYRAGPVDSDVNDDPDENIIPSKVTCQGGTSGSEYCHGYQQGYADEDHAMFSPSPKKPTV